MAAFDSSKPVSVSRSNASLSIIFGLHPDICFTSSFTSQSMPIALDTVFTFTYQFTCLTHKPIDPNLIKKN